MGSKETRRIPKHACTGRLVIVALSAEPPGFNELCVCVCVVDKVVVDNVVVEKVAVEGLAVEGLAVEGLAVEEMVNSDLLVTEAKTVDNAGYCMLNST